MENNQEKMRASHIVYGVDNLGKAVKTWQDKGFRVEYGKKSKKVHAIIYFSEGPFIELMDITSITKPVKILMKVMGWGAMLSRMQDTSIVNTEQGVFCIEQDGNLLDKINILEQKKYTGKFVKNVKRNDTHGRKLRWTLFFPNDLHLPFFMSYYNIDPKPKNFAHPNGVKGIKNLTLVTDERAIQVLKEITDDKRIIFKRGNKNALVTGIEYEYIR